MSIKMADQTIRIKLDCPRLEKQDFFNMERWENEGGNPSLTSEPFDELPKPLKPGQMFEVVDTEYVIEGDQCFFVARINVVGMPH